MAAGQKQFNEGKPRMPGLSGFDLATSNSKPETGVMKHAILGAGAIGGLLGGFTLQSGLLIARARLHPRQRKEERGEFGLGERLKNYHKNNGV